MMASDFKSLLGTAQEIAREKHSTPPAVIKELLHYEILQALIQSGSASSLVFQGGTALRLCYGGIRYSEDLDFVGGPMFDPTTIKPFMDQLKDNVAATYGLEVKIDEHLPNKEDNVPIGRWKSKIFLPQYDKSVKQNYVIHLEVAQVRSYTHELRPIRVISNNLAYGYRSLLVRVESKEEILADKIIALGGREYLKSRDLWDIYMLAQDNVHLNIEFVRHKIDDYHLGHAAFVTKLQERANLLAQMSTVDAFQKEMPRFLDTNLQAMIHDPQVVRQILDIGIVVAHDAINHLKPELLLDRSQIVDEDLEQPPPDPPRMGFRI